MSKEKVFVQRKKEELESYVNSGGDLNVFDEYGIHF